jgi:signal transduction histidine kinase
MGFSLPIGEGITGAVVRAGRSVLVPDVTADPGYVSVADGVRCEMCSPLRSRRGIIGFLDASSTTSGDFDDHDLLLLDTLAEHIAQAIDNAHTLQQLDQVREELSAVVVHDLRNPLTVVMSALDMLAQLELRRASGQGPSPERIASTMLRLHQEARAACVEMLVLTAGLVDLHKLDAGKVTISTEPCSVGDLVRAVTERLGVVAEARHVRLESVVEETLPTVELDMGLMGRMLESLVLHSIKLTPEGGLVCLEVSAARPASLRAHSIEQPTGVVLRVTDTGPSIAPEVRERLFDKFAVVESRRMRQGRGTGLGLAFCKRVAQLHGGAIRVDDNVPTGNAFSILLPG